MKKRFLVTILILLSIVVALWIWTLATPNAAIDIGGSASIDPLMQILTNKYAYHGNKTFIYSSTGSNTGITNLKKDVYDLAFVSKNVTDEDFPNLGELKEDSFVNTNGTPLGYAGFHSQLMEKDEGYYYATFTNEPIVFVYNIQGTGIKDEDRFIDEFIFALTQTLNDSELNDKGKLIIKEIYDHDEEEDFISWHQLARLLFEGRWDYSYIKKNVVVKPYASVPGSGTWSSFQKITGTEPGEAVNKYGNNGSIFYQISKSPGAFGFISMTYAQTIAQNKGDNKHLRTVGIQKDGDVWWVHKNPYKPNYPLVRPFNVVFKLDKSEKQKEKMDAILRFVYWFCTSPEAASAFKDLGLTQAMLKKNNFIITNPLEFNVYAPFKLIDYEENGNDHDQKN